jgi:tetratricopeptide (TPR) repeat protein
MRNLAAFGPVRRVVLVFAAVVALSGCPEINHFREAQNAFNDAAELENRLRLNIVDRTAVANADRGTLEARVRAGYASALVSLSAAEDDQAKVLKDNRLYGNMLVLRALAQWRLGDLAAAEKTAVEAAQLSDDKIFPRDKALALAMPGLIENDQAFAFIQQFAHGSGATESQAVQNAKAANFDSARTLIEGAIAQYDKATSGLPATHPARVYLAEAKLAAYQNLLTAGDVFDKPKTGLEISAQLRGALVELQRAECRAQDVAAGKPLPAGAFERVVSWYLLMAVARPDNACPA